LALKAGMLKQIHVRAVLFALSAFALYMALSPRPPKLATHDYGDKVEHIIAFAVLTLFARAGFRRTSDWALLAAMSLFGALIEAFQALPWLHRDSDWRDWMADTLAAAAVLLAMRFLPWRGLMEPAEMDGGS
jgi:VanZ family protein